MSEGRWGLRGDYTKVKEVVLNGTQGNKYVFEKTKLIRWRGKEREETMLCRITRTSADGKFVSMPFLLEDASVIISGLKQLMEEDRPR